MSVEDLKPDAPFRDCIESDGCFYCGEPIQRLGVAWRGNGTVILLHPHCAYDLSHQLTGDARSAIRIMEGLPLDLGVNLEQV